MRLGEGAKPSCSDEHALLRPRGDEPQQPAAGEPVDPGIPGRVPAVAPVDAADNLEDARRACNRASGEVEQHGGLLGGGSGAHKN